MPGPTLVVTHGMRCLLALLWISGVVRAVAAVSPSVLPAAPVAPALLLHVPHDPVNCWAISPDFAHDHTLFLGEPGYSIVLRSRDGGATFQAINSGLVSGYVQALAISPDFAHDQTLFTADVTAVYRTTSAGDHWERVESLAGRGAMVAIALSPDYAHDRTLFVGGGRGELLVSDDGGAHWQQAELPVKQAVTQIVPSPDFATDHTVLARASPDRLLVSRDGGRSFTLLAAPPSTVLSGLLLDDRFAESRTLWVGSIGDGVWCSTDGGASWRADSAGLEHGAVLHLSSARDARGERVQFAATVSDGVWTRTGEQPWSHDSTGLRTLANQSEQHYFAALPSPAFADDHTVYAITFEGLHVSRRGGLGWEHLQVLPETFSFFPAFSPRFADDDTLFVTTNGYGTLRTRDGGRHWKRLNTGSWAFPDGIAIASNYPDEPAILVGAPKELQLSRDDGASFENCLPGRPGFLHVAAFAPDYATTGTIYAHNLEFQHADQNVFLRSDDRGRTWTATGPDTINALAFATDFAASGRLFVATEEDVQVSTDRGRSWRVVDGLPVARWMGLGVAAAGVAADEAADILLAVSTLDGAWLSRDGGATWSSETEGLSGVRLIGGALSPEFARDGKAFALSQNAGLLVRGAGGAWTSIGPAGQFAFGFALSPTFARDHAIAVCTYAGPWLSRDAGATWTLLDLHSGNPGVPPPFVPAPRAPLPGR